MTDLQTSAPGRAWAAFEAEAMPHVGSLYRLAMWWERDRGAAEDLVQDTLVEALKSFHRFTPGTNCRAWLAAILRHVRSNRLRARQKAPQGVLDDDVVEAVPFVPAVPQHLTDEDVLAALGSIPAAYQDIILLSDVEDLSYKEIAETLGIPMGTVMSRLHRGRAHLRQALAAHRGGGAGSIRASEGAR